MSHPSNEIECSPKIIEIDPFSVIPKIIEIESNESKVIVEAFSSGGGGGFWGSITGDITDQEDLQDALDLKQDLSDKDSPNGYAGLNSDSKLPTATLAYDYYPYNYTLNATNIAQKKVVLPDTPVFPKATMLLPEGGIPQRYGIDFEVVSNEVVWSGKGLDGFLEVGENIQIIYLSE